MNTTENNIKRAVQAAIDAGRHYTPATAPGPTFPPMDGAGHSGDTVGHSGAHRGHTGDTPGTHRDTAHPLAQFVTLKRVPQAVRWVVPGVVEEGVVTIAGARGIGKTTALLPLALSVAGLHAEGYPLAPKPDRWRHVVYIVEQVSQAERVIAGIVEHSGWGITWEDVEARIHIVESRRMEPRSVAGVGKVYRELFTRVVDGVELLPLVVFDTQASIFEMQNENDNAEASRIMALLKQEFAGLPAWVVGHVAKASIGRDDVSAITARGAGAFEADAIANFYLTSEGEGINQQRFFSIGKTRAEPQFGRDLLIESAFAVAEGVNQWGEAEAVHLRWASIKPMDVSRAELRQHAKQQAHEEHDAELRGALFDKAQAAWVSGNPLSKRALCESVTGKTDTKRMLVASLLAEGRLVESEEIPAHLRRNASMKTYLIPLEPSEVLAFKQTGKLPNGKEKHPPTWLKDVTA